VKNEELAQALTSAHHASTEVPAATLGSALQSLVERARAAWPDIDLDDAPFVRYVGERLLPDGDLLDQIASVHADGLYLACACAAGDRGAIERFMTTLWPDIERALAKMGIGTSQREDALSRLSQLLFFGDGKASPIVGTYTGRGTLRSWARSVGLKQALTMRYRDQKLVALRDEILELPASQTNPEMLYLKEFYLEEFRSALGRAIRSVPKRERILLRQHYLDGMTLDTVARVHRVHRATAARWLADAREEVLRRTKQELAGSVDLSPSELVSVMAFVKRQSSFGDDISRIRDALGG
jgi:RNA polymerase sigma-70 factor, ECF subfamily